MDILQKRQELKKEQWIKNIMRILAYSREEAESAFFRIKNEKINE